MPKKSTIIEKAISIFLILIGIYSLYTIGKLSMISIQDSGWGAIVKIIKEVTFYYSCFLIGVLSIISGSLLFKNVKAGWVLSIVVMLCYCLSAIFITFKHNFYSENDVLSRSMAGQSLKEDVIEHYLYGGLLIIFNLVILLTLVSKKFRLKYKPTTINWLTIILLTLILSLDLIFFR